MNRTEIAEKIVEKEKQKTHKEKVSELAEKLFIASHTRYYVPKGDVGGVLHDSFNKAEAFLESAADYMEDE